MLSLNSSLSGSFDEWIKINVRGSLLSKLKASLVQESSEVISTSCRRSCIRGNLFSPESALSFPSAVALLLSTLNFVPARIRLKRNKFMHIHITQKLAVRQREEKKERIDRVEEAKEGEDGCRPSLLSQGISNGVQQIPIRDARKRTMDCL